MKRPPNMRVGRGRRRPPPRVPRGLTAATLFLLGLTAAGFAVFAVWSYTFIRGSFPGSDNEQATVASLPPVKFVGREQKVFDWSRDKCEERDVPDMPARAFRDAGGQVNLIATHYVNRRAIGPTLNDVHHQCAVVLQSQYDPNPAAFADRTWLTSPYTPDGRNVFVLAHDEYQGDKHPGRCLFGTYLPCWYNAITFARSTDGGASYRLSDGHRVVASIPYRYDPGKGPMGLFQPSNVIRSPKDGFYYALLQAERHRLQPAGTCVIRTRDVARPGSWRAWDGEDFTVPFVDPYAAPAASIARAKHVCKPVSYKNISVMTHSVTYNTYLKKFMLVSPASSVIDGRVVYGFYYSLSDDLIDWEPRRLIKEAELLQNYECDDPSPLGYPSILDPRSRSRNFETAGRSPYLYFTRLHARRCALTFDRDLMRVRVRFSKS